MTDKEKALELETLTERVKATRKAYIAAMEMAEYKKGQFRQIVKNYIELAYNNGEQANLLEDLLKDI